LPSSIAASRPEGEAAETAKETTSGPESERESPLAVGTPATAAAKPGHGREDQEKAKETTIQSGRMTESVLGDDASASPTAASDAETLEKVAWYRSMWWSCLLIGRVIAVALLVGFGSSALAAAGHRRRGSRG
jgi:hypothetical protein